jgi:hypothetical protein
MSELDLLNLARSATEIQVNWFGQIITINFAMIVGIYYFLNRANIALKIASFVAYSIGMLVYLSQMLIETNVKLGVIDAMRAAPARTMSSVTAAYLTVYDSWLFLAARLVLNLSFWVLWAGIIYLLFFWKKTEPQS